MRAVADAGREMRDRRRADLDSRHPIGNFRADLEDDRHATTVGVMPLLAVDGPPALTALPGA